jgi:hypothetical protein
MIFRNRTPFPKSSTKANPKLRQAKCLEKETQAQESTHVSKTIVSKTVKKPFAEVALQFVPSHPV